MESLTYKTTAYEGPLDVLLGLIRKNEINIYDIPIAELLKQFLEHIDVMRRENLEVSSDFLTMAATLVQIKSAMLLPRHEEEQEDPREELVNMLLEHERYKMAAESFRENESGVYRFVRSQAKIELDSTYERQHNVYELRDSYVTVSPVVTKEKKAVPSTFTKMVLRKSASITSRIFKIIRALATKSKIKFISLVGKENVRGDASAAFFAALELARAGRVHLEGDGTELTISMTREARKKLKHNNK